MGNLIFNVYLEFNRAAHNILKLKNAHIAKCYTHGKWLTNRKRLTHAYWQFITEICIYIILISEYGSNFFYKGNVKHYQMQE